MPEEIAARRRRLAPSSETGKKTEWSREGEEGASNFQQRDSSFPKNRKVNKISSVIKLTKFSLVHREKGERNEKIEGT